MTEIVDQTELEEVALAWLAETDITVIDPQTGETQKVIAGQLVPAGYRVVAAGQ